MSKQNLNEIYGEPGRGEYAPGDTITFIENHVKLSGEVIHVSPSGETVSGRAHPLEYQVDAGDGWPHVVYTSQIYVEKD